MNKYCNEEGQGLVEYALVLVLVAITVIIILTILGSSVTLAYARIIGSLNDDTLADNAIMLTSEVSMSGTTVCTATLTNIRFVVTDASGDLLTDQTVTGTIRANGVAGPSVSGMANGSGIANVAGPVTVTGSCPLEITMSN